MLRFLGSALGTKTAPHGCHPGLQEGVVRTDGTVGRDGTKGISHPHFQPRETSRVSTVLGLTIFAGIYISRGSHDRQWPRRDNRNREGQPRVPQATEQPHPATKRDRPMNRAEHFIRLSSTPLPPLCHSSGAPAASSRESRPTRDGWGTSAGGMRRGWDVGRERGRGHGALSGAGSSFRSRRSGGSGFPRFLVSHLCCGWRA